jgi:DNA-binding MarR family transcriptional regulator
MTRRQQSSNAATVPRPTSERPEARRVGLAVRELRRAASSQQFRQRVYGSDSAALDPGQHDALDTVVSLGQPRMNELATKLRVDRSTATRTIERLENQGLVQRRTDPTDGRYVVVVATARGIRRQQQLMERGAPAIEQLFSAFDSEQLAVLGDLLDRLVTGFDDLIASNDE